MAVLAREPQDQLAHLAVERRPAGPPVRVCPAARDEPSVPAQQRLRRDEETPATTDAAAPGSAPPVAAGRARSAAAAAPAAAGSTARAAARRSRVPSSGRCARAARRARTAGRRRRRRTTRAQAASEDGAADANERRDAPACTPAAPAPSPRQSQSGIFLHAAVPDRRRMRQYGCEQEGTKASSRRDADAKRDARGRCAPRRPRPRARTVRGGRATRTHISRSSRRNRSDVPRSHVTPARMPSSARCRSRTARVPRSIVSSSPALVAVAAGAVLSRDAGATGTTRLCQVRHDFEAART